MYTFRTRHDSFKVGDRVDTGVALAYRLTESIKTFPQFSVFIEANNVWLRKDTDHLEKDPNSGSDTLYLTPGARMRFHQNLAMTVAPSCEVWSVRSKLEEMGVGASVASR